MSQGLTLSVLRHQYVWGLCAHGHQVAGFFHLVGGLASVKQLRKCASGTVIWILERGVKADDMWEGSVPGRSHSVLHGYIYVFMYTHICRERYVIKPLKVFLLLIFLIKKIKLS